MTPLRTLLLFLSIFFIFSLSSHIWASGDVFPASTLPYAFIDSHTLYADSFRDLIIDNPGVNYGFTNVTGDGHYYSIFPIVLPVLATPIYAIQMLVLNLLGITVTAFMIEVTGKVVAGFIVTLSCYFLYLTLRELVTEKIAIATVLIYAFATSTWAISSQALWQQGLIELFLTMLLYFVVRNEIKKDVWNIAALGILSGLLVFARPSDSLLVIPIAFYVWLAALDEIGWYFIAGAIAGLPFLLYNELIFHSVLGGVMINNSESFTFGWHTFINYAGLLIGPNKGLFIYCPILIASVAGYFYVKCDSQRLQTVLKYYGPILLMNIFIYALFRAGGDGYCFGPRYLTGMVPVLMVYIAMLLEKKKDDTKWVAAIAILVVISVLIQIIGVFYFPFITDAAIGTLPLWDVHHLQIVEAVTSASPYFHRVYLAMIPPLNSPLLIGW